jgi:hypothetical protein
MTMDADVFPEQLPHIPKTLGRKKIKIQRIQDDRNRQVGPMPRPAPSSCPSCFLLPIATSVSNFIADSFVS